jgi:hypothetical protein
MFRLFIMSSSGYKLKYHKYKFVKKIKLDNCNADVYFNQKYLLKKLIPQNMTILIYSL